MSIVRQIRRLKFSYALYNFFNREKLSHNIPVYKKIGLKKKYFSPVSSKDFKGIDERLFFENPSLPVEETAFYKHADNETKESIKDFDDLGYAILKGFLSDAQVDAANKEIDDLLKQGKIKFRYGNKIMFAIHESELLTKIGIRPELLELLSSMIKGNAALFQSINFFTGSEQHTHSDSIHMTTFPLGGLLGVWIALEDIDAEQGALHYYPGSHKLPYYLNSDYDNEGTRFFIGDKDYSAYEDMLEEKLKENKMTKQVFTAKKGDLLIWHANLMHGGEPHTNKDKTRKSMVFHYFNENHICYHEITQRPALIYKKYR